MNVQVKVCCIVEGERRGNDCERESGRREK